MLGYLGFCENSNSFSCSNGIMIVKVLDENKIHQECGRKLSHAVVINENDNALIEQNVRLSTENQKLIKRLEELDDREDS